jgi:hypothetical protein
MKTIEFECEPFLYRVEEFECGDYGAYTCYRTHFYSFAPIRTKRKKWYFFGPEIEITSHEKLFTLKYSIESVDVLAKTIRQDLEREIELLNRAEQIANGQII